MLEGYVPFPEEDVRRYKDAGYWEDITIGEHFDRWVSENADRPALAYGGNEVTYRQMDVYVTRLAHCMTRHGVRTYDRVCMQLHNVPELAYFVYACFQIGAIPICSLPTFRWSELSFLAQESDATVFVTHAGKYKDFEHEEFAEEIRQASPNLKYVFVKGTPSRPDMISIDEALQTEIDLKTAKEEIRRYKPDPMEPALFQLSGGTTGVPKIIPRSHNDYYYNAISSARALEFDNTTRALLVLPLMHNFPLVNGLLGVHAVGGTVLLTESLAPESVLAAISQNKADILMTVPVLLHRLLDLPEADRRKYDCSSLRRVLWGGNPIDPDVQMKFRETFQCDTDQTYGMAEGLICWTRASDPVETKLLKQGRPVSEADDVKVMDVNTKAEVSLGEIGECWVRGPYTLRGYYKSPERNKEVFSEEGYYKTGDLIKRDSVGNITIAGRLKDCISRGAEKINAEEVEGHIEKFSKVKNVAVVAMPDKVMGERVCAFVVPRTGYTFTLEELQQFLLQEQKVARFKVPERLEFIDELPLTNVGKYEKKSLREKIAQIIRAEGKA